MSVMDDATRLLVAYPLKLKSDALDKFKIYKLEFENETGKKIIRLRSDNGGEFINKNSIHS